MSARVSLVLNSYEDFHDAPGPVIEWLEFVRCTLTEPLAARVAASGRDLQPRLLGRLRDSDRLTRRKDDGANWEAMVRRLRGGELDTLWVEYVPDLAFEIEADLDLTTGLQYHISIECGLLPGGVVGEVQPALVGALRRGAQLLRASTGYLTVDAFPCPYEAVMDCEFGNWDRYDEQVRGYYWGNILSSQHLATLGGTDAVLREAPFVVKEDISTPEWQLVYLQTTEQLDGWSDEAVAAARRYLAPLLPGGTPDAELAVEAMHVVEDAPVPERPPVPGTRYWGWLEGVRARTGKTPPALDLDALQAEADALSPGPRTPLAREVLPELFLDSLEVTLALGETPSPSVRADLIRLIDVWAAQGIEGAFGDGVVHSVDRPTFHETDRGELVFGFLADLGSAGRGALDVLVERLERFVGARDVSVDRIILGHGGLEA